MADTNRMSITMSDDLNNWLISNSDELNIKKATLAKYALIAVQKRTKSTHQDLVDFIFDMSESDYKQIDFLNHP